MDEADAGVGFGAEGLLVEGYALVAGVAAVVEAVGGGDAVAQMVERALEGEPVEIFGGGLG